MKVVKVLKADPKAGRPRNRVFVYWWANWRAAVHDAFHPTFATSFDYLLAVEDSEDVRSWSEPKPAPRPRPAPAQLESAPAQPESAPVL